MRRDSSSARSSAWSIEVIRPGTGSYKTALFDFDGTISLIRAGWRDVMVAYFTEVLLEVEPEADFGAVCRRVGEFVDVLTGKQTIYQCIQLAEEVAALGGNAADPLEYKREYHRRLMAHIQHRINGLKEGRITPQELLVPGSLELLQELRDNGLTLYLASGTDIDYVQEEARLLGVTPYFNGGVYGAIDDYRQYSKAIIVQRILANNSVAGHELVGFGDGFVEIQVVKDAGGCAIGVASDEDEPGYINEWKRERLLGVGADAIIPDFRDTAAIMGYLLPQGARSIG